eukprot:scpid5393/ scgid4265/ Protein PRRC2A; HLA-B-associated transcript 2; Proline-rich and coiled-coil-containing protein 2A
MADRGSTRRTSSQPKYSSLNANAIYKPAQAQQQKPSGINRHGLQSLGKVPLRPPKPVAIPSLRKEHQGHDPTVSLVPSGGGGWGTANQTKDKTSSTSSAERVNPEPSPSSTPSTTQTVSQAGGDPPTKRNWASVSSPEPPAPSRGPAALGQQTFQREFPSLGNDNRPRTQSADRNDAFVEGYRASFRPGDRPSPGSGAASPRGGGGSRPAPAGRGYGPPGALDARRPVSTTSSSPRPRLAVPGKAHSASSVSADDIRHLREDDEESGWAGQQEEVDFDAKLSWGDSDDDASKGGRSPRSPGGAGAGPRHTQHQQDQARPQRLAFKRDGSSSAPPSGGHDQRVNGLPDASAANFSQQQQQQAQQQRNNAGQDYNRRQTPAAGHQGAAAANHTQAPPQPTAQSPAGSNESRFRLSTEARQNIQRRREQELEEEQARRERTQAKLRELTERKRVSSPTQSHPPPQQQQSSAMPNRGQGQSAQWRSASQDEMAGEDRRDQQRPSRQFDHDQQQPAQPSQPQRTRMRRSDVTLRPMHDERPNAAANSTVATTTANKPTTATAAASSSVETSSVQAMDVVSSATSGPPPAAGGQPALTIMRRQQQQQQHQQQPAPATSASTTSASSESTQSERRSAPAAVAPEQDHHAAERASATGGPAAQDAPPSPRRRPAAPLRAAPPPATSAWGNVRKSPEVAAPTQPPSSSLPVEEWPTAEQSKDIKETVRPDDATTPGGYMDDRDRPRYPHHGHHGDDGHHMGGMDDEEMYSRYGRGGGSGDARAAGPGGPHNQRQLYRGYDDEYGHRPDRPEGGGRMRGRGRGSARFGDEHRGGRGGPRRGGGGGGQDYRDDYRYEPRVQGPREDYGGYDEERSARRRPREDRRREERMESIEKTREATAAIAAAAQVAADAQADAADAQKEEGAVGLKDSAPSPDVQAEHRPRRERPSRSDGPWKRGGDNQQQQQQSEGADGRADRRREHRRRDNDEQRTGGSRDAPRPRREERGGEQQRTERGGEQDSRPERADRGDRHERRDRAERGARQDRGDRVERTGEDRGERAERPDRRERGGRSERGGGAARNQRDAADGGNRERPERRERTDRPDRERPERGERADHRGERTDRPERADRPERRERHERADGDKRTRKPRTSGTDHPRAEARDSTDGGSVSKPSAKSQAETSDARSRQEKPRQPAWSTPSARPTFTEASTSAASAAPRDSAESVPAAKRSSLDESSGKEGKPQKVQDADQIRAARERAITRRREARALEESASKEAESREGPPPAPITSLSSNTGKEAAAAATSTASTRPPRAGRDAVAAPARGRGGHSVNTRRGSGESGSMATSGSSTSVANTGTGTTTTSAPPARGGKVKGYSTQRPAALLPNPSVAPRSSVAGTGNQADDKSAEGRLGASSQRQRGIGKARRGARNQQTANKLSPTEPPVNSGRPSSPAPDAASARPKRPTTPKVHVLDSVDFNSAMVHVIDEVPEKGKNQRSAPLVDAGSTADGDFQEVVSRRNQREKRQRKQLEEQQQQRQQGDATASRESSRKTGSAQVNGAAASSSQGAQSSRAVGARAPVSATSPVLFSGSNASASYAMTASGGSSTSVSTGGKPVEKTSSAWSGSAASGTDSGASPVSPTGQAANSQQNFLASPFDMPALYNTVVQQQQQSVGSSTANTPSSPTVQTATSNHPSSTVHEILQVGPDGAGASYNPPRSQGAVGDKKVATTPGTSSKAATATSSGASVASSSSSSTAAAAAAAKAKARGRGRGGTRRKETTVRPGGNDATTTVDSGKSAERKSSKTSANMAAGDSAKARRPEKKPKKQILDKKSKTSDADESVSPAEGAGAESHPAAEPPSTDSMKPVATAVSAKLQTPGGAALQAASMPGLGKQVSPAPMAGSTITGPASAMSMGMDQTLSNHPFSSWGGVQQQQQQPAQQPQQQQQAKPATTNSTIKTTEQLEQKTQLAAYNAWNTVSTPAPDHSRVAHPASVAETSKPHVSSGTAGSAPGEAEKIPAGQGFAGASKIGLSAQTMFNPFASLYQGPPAQQQQPQQQQQQQLAQSGFVLQQTRAQAQQLGQASAQAAGGLSARSFAADSALASSMMAAAAAPNSATSQYHMPHGKPAMMLSNPAAAGASQQAIARPRMMLNQAAYGTNLVSHQLHGTAGMQPMMLSGSHMSGNAAPPANTLVQSQQQHMRNMQYTASAFPGQAQQHLALRPIDSNQSVGGSTAVSSTAAVSSSAPPSSQGRAKQVQGEAAGNGSSSLAKHVEAKEFKPQLHRPTLDGSESTGSSVNSSSNSSHVQVMYRQNPSQQQQPASFGMVASQSDSVGQQLQFQQASQQQQQQQQQQ